MSNRIPYSVRMRVISLVLLTAFTAGAAFADGNIYVISKFAWSENSGWQNWRPTYTNVTIVKTNGAAGYLSGYAWGENVGWVRLGATNGPYPYVNDAATNYGVNMNAAGKLSGYAWSETCGWISFCTTNRHDSQVTNQVTINTNTGSFDGYAWGENVGWVHFKNTSPTNYNVRTTVFNLIRKINGVFLEQIKSINGAEPWSVINGLR